MTTQFIKEQQELAYKQGYQHVDESDTLPKWYSYSKEDLDTLITQIAHNFGEELMRLAEEERKSSLYERKGLAEPYKDYMCGHAQPIEERTYGNNQAIDTLKKQITSLTGVENLLDDNK